MHKMFVKVYGRRLPFVLELSMLTKQILLVIVFLTAILTGIAGTPVWALGDQPSKALDPEDVAEIKDSLNHALTTIDKDIAILAQGRNLSDMSVGLFVSNLLGQTGRLDAGLSRHFHPDGKLIDEYLTNVFQYNAEREVAAVGNMEDAANPLAHQAAAAALECLRHIPNSKTSPAAQEEDRRDLSHALQQLRADLVPLRDSLP